jgi:integrase
MKIALTYKNNKLYMRYFHRKSKVLFATKVPLNRRYWDEKHKTISSNHPEYESVKVLISEQEAKLRRVIIQLQTEGIEPTTQKVKDRYFGKRDKQTFWEHFNKFLEDSKLTKRNSTYSNYCKLKNYLELYQETYKLQLDFDSFNHSFYNNYRKMFIKKQLSDNYFGNQIRDLKAVLNAAIDTGHNSSLVYKSKFFKTIRHDNNAVYLTEDELKKLIDLSLVNRVLQNCRDAFIIGAYTGTRYSDLKALNSSSLINGYISYKSVKTNQPVKVPIHPAINDILVKRGGFPKVVDLSDFNKQIKKVCKLAEIESPVVMESVIGGKIHTDAKPKHQLVSSHTMRRSFATNLHLKGIPYRYIMLMTGHRSTKSLESYLRTNVDTLKALTDEIWK